MMMILNTQRTVSFNREADIVSAPVIAGPVNVPAAPIAILAGTFAEQNMGNGVGSLAGTGATESGASSLEPTQSAVAPAVASGTVATAAVAPAASILSSVTGSSTGTLLIVAVIAAIIFWLFTQE
jgi:hypothetical protein